MLRTLPIVVLLLAAGLPAQSAPRAASVTPRAQARELYALDAPDGTRVILYSNGTWKKATVGSSLSSADKASLASMIPPRPGGLPSDEVDLKYDKFERISTAALHGVDLDQGFMLSCWYTWKGDAPSGVPSEVELMLSSTSHDSWQYIRCHDLHLLADGANVYSGNTDHEGTVEVGYVIEHVTLLMPTRSFLRMVNATSVEGELCNTQFTIPPAALAALRDLASHMRTQ